MNYKQARKLTAPLQGSNAGQLNVRARYQLPGSRFGLPNAEVQLTSTPDDVRILDPLPSPPSGEEDASFIATSRWEGVVVERFGTYFSSEVIDLKSGESAYAEFDLAELSAGDVHLCEPGALFYWAVGYRIETVGQRSRCSALVFRRRGTR